MLKWLRDLFVSDVQQNARRYDLIISLLRDQARAIKKLNERITQLMSAQEQQLQEVLGLLKDTVAPGVTEIIKRLNALPVPIDNPALQDEIDGVRDAARSMAEEINKTLNPELP